VRRFRSIVLLVSVAAASLALAGTASAATYSWNLATDFTATAPGANPDHDHYGEKPWSYLDTVPPSGPTAFPPSSFSAAVDGSPGLAGWSQGADFVAGNTTGAPLVTADGDTIPVAELALRATVTDSVTVRWTSPLSGTVGVSATVTPASSGCMSGYSSTPPNGSSAVAPGGTIDLTLSADPLASAACNTAIVSFTITAPATAPAPTVDSPAQDAVLSSGQPVFSGSADATFGAAPQVTVRVYSGSSASGEPVETLSANRAGAGYTARPTPGLADGQYTVQAEQDDLAGDRGFSAPRTFELKQLAPFLTLDQPASGAEVAQGDALFAGRAGDVPGDSSSVALKLYRGRSATGSPIKVLYVTENGPRWSAFWPTRLPTGTYTVLATQGDLAGHSSATKPHTFQIVPGQDMVGSSASLNRAGVASVPIACVLQGPCSGTVLIVTTGTFRAVPGGPLGHLRLLFAFVQIPVGRTVTVRRSVPPGVLSVLRGAGPAKVRITASLAVLGRRATPLSVTRSLRLG